MGPFYTYKETTKKNHSDVFIWNFYLMSTHSNIQFPWGRAAGFGQLLPEEQLFILKDIKLTT